MTCVTLPLFIPLFWGILWMTFECGQTSLKRHKGGLCKYAAIK